MFHAPRAAPDALAFMGFGAQEARCFTTGAKLTAPERKTRNINHLRNHNSYPGNNRRYLSENS